MPFVKVFLDHGCPTGIVILASVGKGGGGVGEELLEGIGGIVVARQAQSCPVLHLYTDTTMGNQLRYSGIVFVEHVGHLFPLIGGLAEIG